MLSKSYKAILNKIIANMKDSEIKVLLDDYICLHNVIMAMYGRHVFCYNGNWSRIKRSFDFNYDYVRENNTSYKLTDIEKKLKDYCNKFILNYNNLTIYYDEFIEFIKSALYEILTDIIRPLRILSPKIRDIIHKYRDFKYKKKSNKINYEVLAILNIELNKQ